MELISIKTAAQLVQESPARIKHLITKKVIEVYPEKSGFFGEVKIIKSSLLAYYQRQLLREIQEHLPRQNYQTLTFQHLQQRISKLSNFKRRLLSRNPTIKKKKRRSQGFAAFLFFFWTLLVVFVLFFVLRSEYLLLN